MDRQPTTKSSANFGSPLLPACAPHLLVPIVHKRGTLKVIPIHELQLHAVLLDGHELAMHPNGYSVHELAERIVKAWDSGGEDCSDAVAQLKYIRGCGGITVTNKRLRLIMFPAPASASHFSEATVEYEGDGLSLAAFGFSGYVEVRAWRSASGVARKTFLGSATARSVQHAFDGDMRCSREFPSSHKERAARMALKHWATKGEEED